VKPDTEVLINGLAQAAIAGQEAWNRAVTFSAVCSSV
jgi:hypothetical protein